MPVGRRVLLALLALLALAAPPALAATPRASLPDIEDEVMCVQCGTALNVSESPVAERQRAFIRRQIAAGRTKEEIKAALVAEYGEAVLATPDEDGAWLVPALLGGAALVGVALVARRWRGGGGGAAPGARIALDPDDERRLDAELAAFDR